MVLLFRRYRGSGRKEGPPVKSRFGKTLLLAGALGSLVQGPVRAADLRQVPWSQLLEAADVICRARLVVAEEMDSEIDSSGAISLATPFRSFFESRASLKGECPAKVNLQWGLHELLDLDEMGSSWILFLTSDRESDSSGEDGWRLALSPRGAWKIELLQRLSWSSDHLEAIVPDSYFHIGDLPEALFSSEHLRVRYYSNLHLDFYARVLRLDLLEAWLKSQGQASEPPRAARPEPPSPDP